MEFFAEAGLDYVSCSPFRFVYESQFSMSPASYSCGKKRQILVLLFKYYNYGYISLLTFVKYVLQGSNCEASSCTSCCIRAAMQTIVNKTVIVFCIVLYIVHFMVE